VDYGITRHWSSLENRKPIATLEVVKFHQSRAP
jgi:hypothetical protein